jgi:hypothetical protein
VKIECSINDSLRSNPPQLHDARGGLSGLCCGRLCAAGFLDRRAVRPSPRSIVVLKTKSFHREDFPALAVVGEPRERMRLSVN